MLRGFLATSGARRASALAVAVVLLLAGAAARADVIQIDPRNPPPTALDPAEDAKLRALMNVSFVPLLSDVSPDDGVVLSVAPSVGPALLDVHSRATTAVSPALFGHRWLTELRWRDARTLVTVAASLDAGTLHLLTVARDGSVTAPPLALGDGIPISLGPGGRRLLVARLSEAARRREPSRVSPFDIEPRQPSFPRVGPAVSDLDARQSIRVARAEARLAVVDLDSGREWPLAAVPLGVGLVDVAWAADETKLSLITAVAPDFRRGGVVQPDSATVLDGLGRLAPADNPFFVTNAFHIYDLGGAQATHRELRPRAGEREVFYSAHWSGSGGTLLVQMMSPSHPKGRTHPSYANLHGARYRLYTSAGVLRRSFSRPEIGSVTSPQFVSPADVVFLSPHRLDWNLYHLNLTTGSFRRLPTPPGSIFQVRATRRSRELVYNHASFLAPYEAYRIGLRDGAPHTLTAFNAAAARASQVQVRRLTFALRSGPREGGSDSGASRAVRGANGMAVTRPPAPAAALRRRAAGRAPGPAPRRCAWAGCR